MAIDDMASVRKQRKDICLKMDINYLANPINNRFVDSYFLQIILLKPLPIVCVVV